MESSKKSRPKAPARKLDLGLPSSTLNSYTPLLSLPFHADSLFETRPHSLCFGSRDGMQKSGALMEGISLGKEELKVSQKVPVWVGKDKRGEVWVEGSGLGEGFSKPEII